MEGGKALGLPGFESEPHQSALPTGSHLIPKILDSIIAFGHRPRMPCLGGEQDQGVEHLFVQSRRPSS